jgi:hypothetical protein
MIKGILLILILSSCTEIEYKITIKKPKQIDTFTLSEQQGVKQIKFLDSLHKIGEF